jgi:hypothetical protein
MDNIEETKYVRLDHLSFKIWPLTFMNFFAVVINSVTCVFTTSRFYPSLIFVGTTLLHSKGRLQALPAIIIQERK